MVAFFLASGGDAVALCERASSTLPSELSNRLGSARPPAVGEGWCRVDFVVGDRGRRPDAVEVHQDGRSLLLVGCLTEPEPVAATVAGAQGALATACLDGDVDVLADRLNGSFALVEWRRGKPLRILADRLGSRPVFVAWIDGSWGIASHPSLLWHAAGGGLAMDAAALGSHLVRATPSGDRTLFALGRRCTAGRVYSLEADGTSSSRAWFEPAYTAVEGRSFGGWADDLVDVLRGSAARLRPLMERPVLFLSGGMDSRLALAALKDQPGLTAVTLGSRPNLETRVAKLAAKAVGVPWSLGGDDDRWGFEAMRDASAALGALYSPLECHFSGYLADRGEHGPDGVLLGDFLEAFAKLLGAKESAALPASVTPAQIVDGIAGLDKEFPLDMVERISSVLRPGVRSVVLDAWRGRLEASLTDALERTPTRALGIDHFLRWAEAPSILTFGMLQDIRSQAPERSLSMCSRVHDLMLSMPGSVRDSGRLHPLALQRLAPALGLLPDSNTLLPAGMPAGLRSFASATRGRIGRLRRRMAIDRGHAVPRTAGSWSAADIKAVHHPDRRALFEDTLFDPAALSPDVFDLDAIADIWQRFSGGEAVHWRIVVNLLAVGQAHRRFGGGGVA